MTMIKFALLAVLLAGSVAAPGLTPNPTAAREGCTAQLAPFLDALQSLRARVEADPTYADYGDALARVQVTHDAIDWWTVDSVCLDGAATTAVKAWEDYAFAYALWRETQPKR